MRYAASPTRTDGLALRQAALVAGIAYLLNPVTFAQLYAMPHLVAPIPTQTVANIAAHPHLFAAAILSYVFSALGDIVLAWSLYILLAPVNRALALLASLLQWIYAAVWLAVIADLGVLYRLILIPDYSSQIDSTQLPSQAVQLLASFRSGWGLALILFGLHLIGIGVLIARSTYIPRWLGWLLFTTGTAWVVNSLSVYLYPNAKLDFLNIIFACELVFMVWLLGWGWRLHEPAGYANASL